MHESLGVCPHISVNELDGQDEQGVDGGMDRLRNGWIIRIITFPREEHSTW